MITSVAFGRRSQPSPSAKEKPHRLASNRVQAIMAEAFFKAPERERKSNFVRFGEIEPHSKKERLVDGLLGALCRARRSVRAQKAARPRPRQRSGARGNVTIADRTSSTANPSSQSPQAVSIRAELIGSDCCSALGIAAYCSAPVLALCRKLIGAGHDSATPLEVWRRDTLALSVRSICLLSKLRTLQVPRQSTRGS